MSVGLLLWVGCGAVLLGGVVALIAYGRGSDQVASPRRVLRLASGERERRRTQIVVALVGAALGWLISGYVVALLIVPLLVFGLPWFLRATMQQHQGIDRLEALAEWTQRLSDVLLLGMGVEQALAGSLRTAPAAIEADVADLVGRIQSRMNPEEALRQFGDRLGDATADKVLATLLLRINDRGPGLARALTDMADSVREEVRQRRVIEADRAKHRSTIRWLVLVLVAVSGVIALDPSYAAPYATTAGQIVLAVDALLLVVIIAWMASMATHRPVPRFLEADGRSRVAGPVSVQEEES
ncbi:type II secretion system F family protein [Streptacidiphilus jiangxiensis]|uniref:Flp pilus assembly protein TadB n=1 Tax=Streptacidiphilus jiangxiensis TaxID=235985 RepID=A0A1H7T5X5_STRJI|nr:type II secretion system F family protein [Streptacidiphilus jiangxiensis]SEL80251.1 Flp pilus assembly protein TadB [Streptacidiphilus jiangxiensis]